MNKLGLPGNRIHPRGYRQIARRVKAVSSAYPFCHLDASGNLWPLALWRDSIVLRGEGTASEAGMAGRQAGF